MIYAIPNDGERVANHFVKAPYIAIYSDTDGMLKKLSEHCFYATSGLQCEVSVDSVSTRVQCGCCSCAKYW